MQPTRSSVKPMLLAAACAVATLAVPSPCAAAADGLDAVFFFSPGCRMCAEAKAAVRSAKERFGDRLRVEWVDMSDPDRGTASAARLFAMLDRFGVKETPELTFFVGRECVAGGERIVADLSKTVARELERERGYEAEAPDAMVPPAGREEVHDRLGLWAVTAAALADGVNPCAFATIVLLVSMMATARRTRREVLLIGGAFAVAVFLTYFVIGLAFYGVLSRLSGFFMVSDVIYLVAFGACVVCGALSLWDALLAARRRPASDMLLRLPDSLRERIEKRLRDGVRSRSFVVAAFAAGVVVSVFESACTGQVYFPVIARLVRAPGSAMRGLGLLFWYNAVFVAPLVAILAMAVAGVQSVALTRFGRSHWGIAKVLLALTFAAMAVWMWPGLVWPPGVR